MVNVYLFVRELRITLFDCLSQTPILVVGSVTQTSQSDSNHSNTSHARIAPINRLQQRFDF
jgi:hypothetical protein